MVGTDRWSRAVSIRRALANRPELLIDLFFRSPRISVD